jgi:hypothetical protein
VDKTPALWLDDLNPLPVHDHFYRDSFDADQGVG